MSEPLKPAPVAPPGPQISTAERRLDPRAVTVARLGGAIFAAMVGLVSLVGAVIVWGANGWGLTRALGMLALWLLINGALTAWVLSWPPVRHRHISYRVDESGIEIHRGVWWRTEISVPRNRIQHTDVSQGPIERGFGLSTLVLHTAGTENASVSLGGLSRATAIELRDFLIGVGDDDAV